MMSFEQYVNYSEEKLERVMLGYCKQVEPELSVIIPKEITALIQLFGTSPFVKFRELTSILNKMTPEKFTKIAKQTIDIVNIFADTKDSMEQIIGLVLQFGIKQPVFVSQYADLCGLLFAHLPKLGMICEFQWVLEDPDVSSTFRKMVIQQTNDLFTTHRNYTPDDIHLDSDGKKIVYQEELDLKKSKLKDNFFAVMVLVGELYNVELIKRNLVYKGVFEVLLPPKNTQLSEVDLEGLCRLFKRCGKKLDEEGKKHVDKYLQKLQSHAHRFTFRTKVLVDEIKEMRSNDWKHRLKKETAKTKAEIRDEFEDEQAKKESSRHGHHNSYGGHGHHKGRGGGRKDYRDDRRGGRGKRYDDEYDDEYYNVGYDDYDDRRRGKHGYSTNNLRDSRVPLKASYKEKRGDRDDYRSSRGSASTSRLRKVGMRSTSRYDDNHSWGDDGGSQNGGSNGRYKPKFGGKLDMSPSKSYGMYQKKSSSSKPRNMVRTKSDSTGSDTHSRNGSYGGGGFKNGGGQGSQYGDAEQKRKLNGFIDEYVASGVMDDILDYNCTDYKVWAAVINDGLRDRKSSQIKPFIDLVIDLFEQGVLDNRQANFVNIVVKYLTIQLDESSMDCPNFTRYVAQLFANLVYNEYLKAET